MKSYVVEMKSCIDGHIGAGVRVPAADFEVFWRMREEERRKGPRNLKVEAWR